MKRVATLCLGLLAFAAVTFTAVPSNAQNPATYGSSAGRYGLTSWAIDNQRVASQFNYDIDSLYGSGLGAYTFPQMTCQQALPLGGNKNVNPFNTNASIKIVDINSSNTETVNGVTPTYTNGYCTLPVSTTYTHYSYHLRSGTCGLQEAINDLGANGGEVIVDQKFYDDGCTQATITGLNPLVTSTSGPVYGTTFVHDISNGQDTWYALKPSATTALSAPSAPTVATSSTAGSLSTSTTYYVEVAYVDLLGGITAASSETSQGTSTSTALGVTAPAASTGAVGYIVYFGSSSGAEIMLAPGSASLSCPATTLESVIPACAMGSNATVLNTASGTAKPAGQGQAHTTFAFQPVAGPPSTFTRSTGTFETSFLPYGTVSSVGTSADVDLAQVYIPAGYFNYLGKSWDVCFKINGTGGASGTFQPKVMLASALDQSPVTVFTGNALSASSAAFADNGCVTLVTAATGSSGTFWATGGVTGNVGGTITSFTENSTAVSSTVNLTGGVWLTLTGKAGTAASTNVTVNLLSIRPTPGT